jgi:DnaJ-class molecular chaperone
MSESEVVDAVFECEHCGGTGEVHHPRWWADVRACIDCQGTGEEGGRGEGWDAFVEAMRLLGGHG